MLPFVLYSLVTLLVIKQNGDTSSDLRVEFERMVGSGSLSIQLLPLVNQEVVWQVLMHAAHEETDVRDSSILAPYGKGFGELPGDLGFAAYSSIGLVGAAWVRLLKDQGFGYINDNSIPELAIAILPEFHGHGVGTLLLDKLLESARKEGIPGICLSCRSDNRAAVQLYHKMGFCKVLGSEVINREGSVSFNMVYYVPRT